LAVHVEEAPARPAAPAGGHGGARAAPAHGPAHGKGHKGGHGGGDGHGGGGGHGGSWIVTYSDMITLLMAMFICIITFSSREPERYSKKRDSLMYGEGGTGIAGKMSSSLEQDAVVWRKRPVSARAGQHGSEMPPLYSEPALEATAAVLRRLDGPLAGTLADNYALRVPLAVLFGPDGTVSAAGKELLASVARNLRQLPYDIAFQFDDARDLPRGVRLCQHLAEEQGIPPSRLAVGVREGPREWSSSVWITFARRQ